MKRIGDVFRKHKRVFFAIGIIGLFVHIILFESINSTMLVPFLIYWMFLGIVYKLNEKYFFGLALFFLILSVPPFLFGKLVLAERFSVWEYLFLVMGLWQWFLFDVLLAIRRKK